MKIRNLTPHTINIIREGQDPLVLLPDPAGAARVAEVRTPVEIGALLDLGIVPESVTFGEVAGLPDPEPGVWYLVSAMCLEAAAAAVVRYNRAASLSQAYGDQYPTPAPVRPTHDLCSPGVLVRDASGQPVGCKGVRVIATGL